MKIEIAVGQVWEDEDGEQATVAYVTSKEVCGVYEDEGMYVWPHAEHLASHTLIKHQNGADIDAEKYDYAVGDDDAPEYWCAHKGGWRPRLDPHHTPFTRTPKVKELPYVDCMVDQEGMTYELPSSYTCNLLTALSDRNFTGYVYEGGSMSSSPRILLGEETPAQIPTHVRFAR